MTYFTRLSHTRVHRRRRCEFAQDLSPHMRRDIGLDACAIPPRLPRHLLW